MRRASHDTQWLKDETGSAVGLALGYDFCAEHEWGIKRLKEDFGVPVTATPMGLIDRKITQVPEGFLVYKNFTAKPYDKRPYDSMDKAIERTIENFKFYDYKDDPKLDLIGAWDESTFAVIVRGEENITWLYNIYRAFLGQDILFGTGKGGFLRSHGLTFVIDSLVSDEERAAVLAADEDHKRLLDAAKATGIEERLKKAGKRYYALSPRFWDDTRTEVSFWLNPMDQHLNNYGWFSVADLDAWIAGKGPIPKEKPDAPR